MPVPLFLLVATTALLSAGHGRDQPACEEMAKLTGTWQLTACEQNGSKAPAEWVAKRRLEIAADGSFTATTQDVAETNTGQVVLHLGGIPHGLDLKTEKGPFAGKTVSAIYEFENDELRVCFPVFGTDRPTAFTSGPGSGHILTVYKRVAK